MAKNNDKEVFERFKNTWGDRYDYSDVIYVRSDRKVIINCREHGKFEQQPNYHWRGQQGCKKCFYKERDTTQLSWDEVLERFIKEHSNLYDYSNVNYTTYNTPINIGCQEHGNFEQPPYLHWGGMGCPKCKKDDIKLKVFRDFKKWHKNKYDYSKVKFDKIDEEILIICPEHGEFRQYICNHRKGSGCPKCSKTRMEIYINENHNNIFLENNRKYFGMEIDLLNTRYKFGIEYNGLLWHSFGTSFPNNIDEIDKYKHLKKTIKLNEMDYRLFNIESIEYKNKPNIVNSIISINTGNFNKIFARNCKLEIINAIKSRNFLENNHLYYNPNSQINLSLGLYYNNQLVQIMTFKKLNDNSYFLNYFVSNMNTRVLGGVSKLLTFFIRNYNFDTIFTSAKLNYPIYNIYKFLNFEEWLYIFPQKQYISKYAKFFIDPKNYTNEEEILLNDCRIYYDCGEMIYKYNKRGKNE